MAEDKNNQLFQNSWYHYGSDHHMIKNNDHNYEKCASSSSSSSSSMISNGSDTTDEDASSSSNSSGSLYDLSEIMAQLPIKRGLSKFYNGKSESFASLARVTSTEDLAKKVTYRNRRKKMKVSKSYGTGLNNYKKNYTTLPKPIISKKTTRPRPSPAASLLSCQTKKSGSCRLYDQ